MAGFDESLGRAAARWVAGVERRPRGVALALAALTAALGLYAARNLGVNADLGAMIAEDLPFRVNERAFDAVFPTAIDRLLVVVDGESASAAGRAADALAERLRPRTDLFARVAVVGGGEFFDRNALLYLDTDEIEDFVDRLAAVQPFLGEIGRDPSLVGLSDLLVRALEARDDRAEAGLDLAAALDRLSQAVEAGAQGRASPDPWGDALIGGTLSEELRQRVISLVPRSDFTSQLYAEPALLAIRAAARELRIDAAHGLRVRATGDAPLNYDEALVVDRQGKIAGLVSFALFSTAMFLGLRTPRTILALVGSLVAAVVWTNAFAALAIGQLNQVSAAFNVLIIGLGGELGIHFCMRHRELLALGRARGEALVETGRTIGGSLVSSAGTTGIGFLVFLPTDYRGVAELGLISGAGMLLSLVATLTLLPALLSLGAGDPPLPPRPEPAWVARLRRLPLVWAGPIRRAALALGLVSLALLPHARFDHNPVRLRDPATESVQAMQELLSRSGTSPWTAELIAPDIESARVLAERIAALPPVEEARTLADWLPEDQEEKIALLEEAALFLPPRAERRPEPEPAAQLAALGRLEAALVEARAAPGAASPELAASIARLEAAIRAFQAGPGAAPDPGPALARLAANAVGTLPQQLEELRTALAPRPVHLEDLPAEIADQMLAPDGRARVQVIAKRDLSDTAVLEEFVDAVHGVAPDATGPAVTVLEWGRVTAGSMLQALGTGLACMALFLFLLWRSVRDTLLAFFPLLLAALLVCAAMVVADMPFDFANVIVLPLLIGMGIDNGVHLVHRHRTRPEEVELLHTSTARAVFYSALTTVLCFGSLALASHRGMASLGKLLTLGVAATLVCYVVVLPAVLEWDDRRQLALRERRRARSAGESAR